MSEQHPLYGPAVDWFNATWDLMAKEGRSPAEDLDMLALAQASFSAWLQVPDHTATHESIGAWQVSRVHALVGEGRLAEAWALRSFAAADDASVDPFYRSYALEALARAYRVQGRPEEVLAEVARAREALEGTAETELEALQADLAELEEQPGSGRLYSISFHRPKPGFEGNIVESMHRYGAAARDQAGLVEVHSLRSRDGRVLAGLAVWESAAAKVAANPALGAAVENDDFAAWEEGSIQSWALESV